MKHFLAALMFAPGLALAGELTVEKPMIPLAPPRALAHAAFMKLTNEGDVPRQLISVSAEGYHMAHIHKSEEKDGITTMSSVDLVEIAPGQSVNFEHGGLHVMLMKPMGKIGEGDKVSLTLEFANGETKAVEAIVMKMMHEHS